MALQKAKRSMAKIKLAVSGMSGSGKTLSSLQLAYGLVKAAHANDGLTDAQIWDKICVIDTENASASLYVGTVFNRVKTGEYNVINLHPPFKPAAYIDAIGEAEDYGIEFLIIDSLSHAWVGEGGMLDMQAKASAKYSGNSYMAWRDVTPEHNRLVQKILQCNMHVCITLRTKTEYVTTKDERTGKSKPEKVGLAPVFRDGVEYEVTTFFDIDSGHYATTSKDRTGMFDDTRFIITPEVGEKIYKWLNSDGTTAANKPDGEPVVTGAVPPVNTTDDGKFAEEVEKLVSGLTKEQKTAVVKIIKKHNGGSSAYKEITDPEVQDAILTEIREALEEEIA